MSDTKYRVFARRFRPTKFDEVIAQKHVCETLMNAIRTKRVAHAYLFSGPRGVGKTSVARIYAKSLNCEQGPTLDPCGECVSCVAIAEGDDTDVMEIDGASNRGIDEIRDLREKVRFAPGHGLYKIYIIDEVHMLTDQAFNALLKTLEEPPEHVIFIFATTRAEKVPDTIISRCQRYPFRRIPTSLIRDKLAEIAQIESINVEPDALSLLARRAAGSLRDGESLFDQVIAFSAGEISTREVERSLGLVAGESVDRLVRSVLDGDGPGAISAIDRLSNEGADLVQAAHQSVGYLRNLMILNTAPDAEDLVDLSSEELDKMKELALSLPGSTILSIMDIFLEATGWMSRVLSPRLLLEYSALKAAKVRNILPLEDFIAAFKDPEAAELLKEQTPPDVLRRKNVTSAEDADTSSLLSEGKEKADAPASKPEKESKKEKAPKLSGASAVQLWDALLKEVNRSDASNHSMLTKGRVADLSDDVLTVGFPRSQEMMAKMLGDEKRRKPIEAILKELTGRALTVKFIVEEDERLEGEASASSGEPEVEKAKELFGGDVIDVRDAEEEDNTNGGN
ncbi:MAG: DNA polymerase III subunit gamma/tau [bacterium]|nr:DNA polymerase III subunit gamma/tau [bacterium]